MQRPLPFTNRFDNGEGCGQGHGIWPLYVGLFLVLLSFFIMLVGLSETQSARASAVAQGLRLLFPAQPGRMERDKDLTTPGAAALAKLGRDLEGLYRLIEVEQDGRGEELRVTLPASELFLPDRPDLRGDSTRLLDRVVAACGAAPPCSRLEVAFSLGRPERDQQGGALALAVRRDGAFARALVARGASPDAVSVGIDHNQPERASIVFRYLPLASPNPDPR